MVAVLAIYAVFGAVFASGAIVSALIARRRVEQAALMWTLLQAVERRYPLADEVAALADGERPARRARLLWLAEALAHGMPLDDALASDPRLVPADVLLMLRIGTRNGLLVTALRHAVNRRLPAAVLRQTFVESAASWVCYLIALTLLISGIVTFVMISIIPKFKKIFEDFGTELPGMTKLVIGASDTVVNFAPLVGIGLVAGIGLLVWLGIHMACGGSVPIPFVTGVRRAAPGVLRVCALHVQAARPLHDALQALGERHPQPSAAEWLRSASQQVIAGADGWTALAEAGFLNRSERNVLASAAAVGNLPWALAELADAMERRWADRLRMAQELIRPAIVLPFGLLVLSIAAAFFLPLVKLLNDLS